MGHDSRPTLRVLRRLLVGAICRLTLQPVGEILIPAILRIPRDGIGVIMVQCFDYEIKFFVGKVEFHIAMGSQRYRFFPAFFIRSAYAAVARTDAARRMAAVHLGRLRV
jgi:hypothetical protein